MAQNFWIAIIAWSHCFVVTIAGEPGHQAEARGGTCAAWSTASPKFQTKKASPWYQRPGPLAVVVAVRLRIV